MKLYIVEDTNNLLHINSAINQQWAKPNQKAAMSTGNSKHSWSDTKKQKERDRVMQNTDKTFLNQ